MMWRLLAVFVLISTIALSAHAQLPAFPLGSTCKISGEVVSFEDSLEFVPVIKVTKSRGVLKNFFTGGEERCKDIVGKTSSTYVRDNIVVVPGDKITATVRLAKGLGFIGGMEDITVVNESQLSEWSLVGFAVAIAVVMLILGKVAWFRMRKKSHI